MEQLTDAIILSPDKITAQYLCSTIAAEPSCTAIVTTRKWIPTANDALERATQPILVINPSEKMGIAPIGLASECAAREGLVLVWSPKSQEHNDNWLLLQLLKCQGALVCSSLDVLAQIAWFFRQLNGTPFSKIYLGPTKHNLGAHLRHAIYPQYLSLNAKDSLQLKIDASANIRMLRGKTTWTPGGSPSVIGEAASLLCGYFHSTSTVLPSPAIASDKGTIEIIARPPARILSETTSKRLFGAFGLQTPSESLCDSPSKAVRFAKQLDSSVTMKLIRPNFPAKQAAGGVIQQVKGPSEIQKAYQSLQSLANQLGNPKPLGILVSRHITSEALYWIETKRHPTFGRILRFGRRHETKESPDGALRIPCSFHQCRQAITQSYANINESHLEALANACYRFSAAINALDSHIGLAQIHPLVLTDQGALMLDAVIGITDHAPTQPNPF